MAKQGLGNQSQDVSERFRSLLREEVAARKEEPLVFRVLKEHEDLVREARRELSFKALSEVLKKAGIEASPYEVREFCRTVLSEPARKRKRPRRKSAVPTQKTSPLSKTAIPGLKLDRANETSRSAAPKTVQAGKPGFRVARDEEL